MAIRTFDPIGDAITATEKEIAGAAWDIEDTTLDETGDRTVEQMGAGLEGQHEPDDEDELPEDEESEGETESEEGEGEADEEAEGKGETEAAGDKPADKDKPAPKVEGAKEGLVPPAVLREARAERDALRAQLDAERAEAKRQFDALNARMEQLATSMRAPPKAAEPEAKPVVPDFFEDPAGFLAAQTKPLTETVGQLQQQLAAQRVETSMAIAHSKHGDTFAKAFEWVGKLNPQNPDDRALVQRIYANPNPGEALVAQFKRTETLRRVGDDPDKYEKDIEARVRETLMKDPAIRKQIIDAARAEASRGADGEPRTEVRLPKSLNGAAGGNRRDATVVQYDDNDQAIAEAAWR
jgi:hypothetical protein